MSPSLIKTLPFFDNFPDEIILEISQNAKTINFDPGQTILRVGDRPSYMMVVLSGTVQVNELSIDGRVIGLSYSRANDLIAWLSIIDNKPLSQTVVAVSKCELLVCPIKLIQNLVGKHVLLANLFLKLSSESIRNIAQTRAMLNLPNAFHRVFVQISLLSVESPATAATLPKQQEIAESVNTSRETVSRALHMLIKKGVLQKVGHRIVVTRVDMLKKLAIDGPESLLHTKS